MKGFRQATTGTRRKPRLLIVEGDPAAREFHAAFFRGAGWHVEDVVREEEAITVAAAFQPEVVLTGLHATHRDALETTRLLRRDARTRHVPLVVMSARDDLAIDAIAAGANVFVRTPCPSEELLYIVETLLQQASARPRAAGRRA